ncbi:hypothetical protein [Leucobacter chromiiresistens]|nr:hypothetical protein [Leucobacter chromiiresistens]
MTKDLKPSDDLYYSIKGLPGWNSLLRAVQDGESDGESTRLRRLTGELISSVLLAAGEDTRPVAISGGLDDEWSGRFVAVYPTLIVVAETESLYELNPGSFNVKVWPTSAARNLKVRAVHNYFKGADRGNRTDGVTFRFELDDEAYEVKPTPRTADSTPRSESAAIYEAFKLLRDTQP